MFRQRQKNRAVYEMMWKNRAARQATGHRWQYNAAQNRFDLHVGQPRQ